MKDLESFINEIQLQHPEINFIDMDLPGVTAAKDIPLLLKQSPGIKIIAFSTHHEPTFVKETFKRGAIGYLTKTSGPQEFLKAIQFAKEGKRYICQEIVDSLSEPLLSAGPLRSKNFRITAREQDLIQLIKQGLNTVQIAEKMGISSKTVESHKYNIIRKLKLKNATALNEYIHKYHPEK
jgi:DNA-binding NarL/FixJ family response regulator